MKFCIALVSFWQEHGFDCADWRKSADGTKAIVHIEYAKVLIPDVETNSNVTVYTAPSIELDAILNSSEWAVSAD
jgi:hypothetical protein